MKSSLKTRRHFIKQLSLGSGSVLLNPLAHQLAAEAAGTNSAFPQRFVFLIKSSGLTPEAITPKSLLGKTAIGSSPFTATLKDHALPESLQPLEPFKNQVGIVQGFSGKMCLAGHTAYFGAMGVHPSPSETSSGIPLRATIDTRLSSKFPSPFGHVGLALRGRAVGGASTLR